MFLHWIAIIIFTVVPTIGYAKYVPPQVLKDPSDVFLKVQYSKEDYNLARIIDAFYYELRKGRLNKSTVRKIKRAMTKSDAFEDFQDIIERARKISEMSNKISVYRIGCSSKFTSKPARDLKEKLNRLIDKYCRGKLLSMLNKRSLKETKSKLDILNMYLPFYLKGEHRKKFTKLLRKIKSSESLSREVSKRISDQLIENTIHPREAILKHVIADTKLKSYVQSTGHYDRKYKRSLTKDFRNIVKRIYKHLEKQEYDKAFEKEKELIHFHQSKKKYLSKRLAWKTFYLLGKKHIYNSKIGEGQFILKQAFEIGNEEQKEDALFVMLSGYILNNDYESAKKIIDKYKLLQNFALYNNKLKYWIAYVVDKSSNKKMAIKYFKRLLEADPLSFYSVLAIKYLMKNVGLKHVRKYISLFNNETNFIHFPLSKYSKELKTLIKRLMLWCDLKNSRFATIEMNTILSLKKGQIISDKVFLKSASENDVKRILVKNLGHLLSENNEFLLVFKLLYASLNNKYLSPDNYVMKLLFPFEYFSQVKKVGKNHVDPLIIMSLIRQESAFNPKAKSRAGARGLMQLMYATAKRVDRRSVRKLQKNHLKNPELNLKLGIKYFKSLANRYRGNLIYVLAAYNAGERRLKQWVDDVFPTAEDPLMIIESIPFKETNLYVKLILRNIFFYRLLSGEMETNDEEKRLFTLNLPQNQTLKRKKMMSPSFTR